MRKNILWGAKYLLVLASALVSACGGSGGSPTMPSVPSGPTTQTIQVASVDGTVVAATEQVSGAMATITAPGFNSLVAPTRYGSFKITPALYPPDVLDQLVFSGSDLSGTLTPDGIIIQLAQNVTLIPDATAEADPIAMSTLQDAAATASASGCPYTFAVATTTQPGTLAVQLVYDPGSPNLAYTVGGTVIHYRLLLALHDKTVILHEIGRVMGLGGLNPQAGVMNLNPGIFSDYTSVEKLAIRTLFGNAKGAKFDKSSSTITWP